MYSEGSGRQVYLISTRAVLQNSGEEWRMFSVHPVSIMHGADKKALSFPSVAEALESLP